MINILPGGIHSEECAIAARSVVAYPHHDGEAAQIGQCDGVGQGSARTVQRRREAQVIVFINV
jgi:hypothetical protein